MSTNAFTKTGNTVVFTAATFAPTPVQCSSTTLGGNPFLKNYAGIGYTYDSGRDAFIPPKPFNSWVLNEFTCRWDAPVAMPSDDKRYLWDENTVNWIEVTV